MIQNFTEFTMLTDGTPYTVDYSFGALSLSDAGQYTCIAVLVNDASNAALGINQTTEVTGTCPHTFRKYIVTKYMCIM